LSNPSLELGDANISLVIERNPAALGRVTVSSRLSGNGPVPAIVLSPIEWQILGNKLAVSDVRFWVVGRMAGFGYVTQKADMQTSDFSGRNVPNTNRL